MRNLIVFLLAAALHAGVADKVAIQVVQSNMADPQTQCNDGSANCNANHLK